MNWDSGAVWTYAGAIVLLVLAHQVQLGGGRRRMRQRIQEELALLEKLAEHPEVAKRLAARIGVLLQQYEPAPEVRRTKAARRGRLAGLGATTVTAVVLILALNAIGDDWTWWGFMIAAFVAGGAGNVAEVVVRRRNDVREQDEAVDQVVIQLGIAEEHDEALPGRVEARSPAPKSRPDLG